MKINVWNGFDSLDDEHEEEQSSYSIARSVVPEPLYIAVDKLGFPLAHQAPIAGTVDHLPCGWEGGRGAPVAVSRCVSLHRGRRRHHDGAIRREGTGDAGARAPTARRRERGRAWMTHVA